MYQGVMKKLLMSTKIEIGRCYWYEPMPTEEDDACPNCNFLFASDEEPKPTLVLVKRALISFTSSCPECEEMIDLSVAGMQFHSGDNVLLPYVRVMNLDFRNYSQSDVSIKWLHIATENEVTNWFLESEKQADAILNRWKNSHEQMIRKMGLKDSPLNALDSPTDDLT